MNHLDKSLTDVAKVTAVVLAGICLAVAIAATIVIARDFILLIFLGILFGVFLTHLSGLIAKHTPFKPGLESRHRYDFADRRDRRRNGVAGHEI